MDILQHIGNTPLIKLRRTSPNPDVEIWAKLELANPSGSLKDRIALYMIEEAEKRGDLRPGMTIIEATSGNTGIALGMVAAVKGYPLKLFMLESKTIERRKLLRFWGADLVLTTKDDPDSHIWGAKELAEREPGKVFYIDQNENPDNVLAHYHGTGREVADELDGKLDVFITGYGTGGCLTGAARCFRDRGLDVQVVAVEPATSKEGIDGLKNSAEVYQPPIYDRTLIARTETVLGPDAIEATRALARNEGLIAGLSSGAHVAVAQKIAAEMDRGRIVVVLCDRGERYFSTPVFRDA